MSDVAGAVRSFVLENFLFGQSDRMPADDESLVETGVIDSTGVLELIEFLESTFGIAVGDEDAVPENLDTIDGIAGFVGSKRLVA